MASLLCPKCKVVIIPVLTNSGPHTKASCPGCGSYIKFIRQAGNEKNLLDVVLKILPRLGERERQAVMEAINANEAR